MERKAKPSAKTSCVIDMRDGTHAVYRCEDKETQGVRRIVRKFFGFPTRGKAVSFARSIDQGGKGL